VCIYGKTKEEPLPSLKKHSTVVDFSNDAKEGLVKMSREAALEDDPSSTVVDSEDIIKAYFYGKSVVPVSVDDEELLRYPSRKCLKVLGYLSSAAVPRHFFMAGVDMVLPAPDPDHERGFAAYVQALYQRDDVVLARYSAKDNQSVRLVVLTPCIKPELICLWLNYLPTSEDYRDFPFNELAESTTAQQDAAEAFINSLSLDKTDENEERLKPSSLFSPTLQYFYQCLAFRAENPGVPLPALDENIERYLRPDREMFNAAEEHCLAFMNAFQLKEVEVVNKEKKMYVDLLKGKNDEPQDDQVGTVGDLDPVSDFEKMMKDRKKDLVDAAVSQMEDVILRLLEKDFRGNLHRKVLECLKTLRKGCIDEDLPSDFNSFLAIKIKNLQGIHTDFWNFMVDQGVSLISKDESKASRVSQNEAKAFLVKVQKPQGNNPVADLDEIE
jgi:ATP-dependent DNA helicase 2 subunit 2